MQQSAVPLSVTCRRRADERLNPRGCASAPPVTASLASMRGVPTSQRASRTPQPSQAPSHLPQVISECKEHASCGTLRSDGKASRCKF